MKPTKSQRQERLLALIASRPIATQSELVAHLRAEGLEITQATISRDIKELNIIKAAADNGKQRYVSMSHDSTLPKGRLMKVFSEAVVTLSQAQNLLILRTLPGMAGAAAAALDSLELPEVVGSVAGDDTIFIAAKDAQTAEALQMKLKQLISFR